MYFFDSKTFSQLFRESYFPNLVYCGQRKGGLCNCLVSAKIVLLTKDLSVYIGYVKKCGKFYFVSKQKTFQRKTTRHWLFSILNCGISRHSMLHFSLKLNSKSLLFQVADWRKLELSWKTMPIQIRSQSWKKSCSYTLATATYWLDLIADKESSNFNAMSRKVAKQ